MNTKVLLITLLSLVFVVPVSAEVTVKVKDIAYIDGLKENQVFGYGLVVGLQGTGDSRIHVTKSSLRNVLKNMGMDEESLEKSKNVAAVLVTARLPEMVRVGDRVDVTVSSIGDAKSVEGGILLQAPLKGADGNTYVVAQGKLSSSSSSGNQRNRVKTVSSITRGGIVERDIQTTFTYTREEDQLTRVSLVLNDFDFALANQIADLVKEEYTDSNPTITQSGKISFTIPKNMSFSVFIEKILELEVTPDYGARVVINEKEGTIVMGGAIKVSEAVVSKEGLTVTIDGEDREVGAALISESTTVADVVDALNYAGLSASDIISVLKALKDAGSLHAELIIK